MPRRGTKRRRTNNNSLLTIYHGIEEEADGEFGVDTAGYLYSMILPNGRVVQETPDSLRLSTNGDDWFVTLAGDTDQYEIFETPEEAFEYIKDEEVWLRSLKEFQELVDNNKEWMAVARKHRPRIYVPRFDYDDDDDLVVAI